jgi:DNA Polymerase alpha zinc finger
MSLHMSSLGMVRSIIETSPNVRTHRKMSREWARILKLVNCSKISNNLDYAYYLAKQILPPIERLCAPIDCTDSARIAECLGFDPKLFRSVGPINTNERAIEPLESQISDEERFRDSNPLLLKCLSCSQENAFTGIASSKVFPHVWFSNGRNA